MTLKKRIIDLLQEKGKTGRFFEVEYRDDNSVEDIDPVDGKKIEPASCHANETNSTYGPDTRNGREEARIRTEWTFDLYVTFPAGIEVNAEYFELDVTKPVLRLKRDEDSEGAALNLVNVQYSHPPRKNAESSTEIVYTFSVIPNRR